MYLCVTTSFTDEAGFSVFGLLHFLWKFYNREVFCHELHEFSLIQACRYLIRVN